MAITEADVAAKKARERVERNWTPPGRTLNVLIAGDIRPLTTGHWTATSITTAGCGRATPEDERKEVERRLTNVAREADWSLRDAVLTVCALAEEIQARSAEDWVALREILRRGTQPGVYPELERGTSREVAGRERGGCLESPTSSQMPSRTFLGRRDESLPEASSHAPPPPTSLYFIKPGAIPAPAANVRSAA
jgi:hypothetical protein